MDCKDLMVGDWVAYKDDPPYIVRGTSICKVVTIDNGIDHRNVMDDAINPIPLTEEILVKNGFKKFAEGQANFDYTDNDIHLEYWIGDGCFRYYTAEIRYVHQLQHLLRLCGIEKEIEL